MRRVVVAALAGLACFASAQEGTPVPQGPAYQYEGKWMAQVQTASGTLIETVASCAAPIVLTADNAGTLRRADGMRITVSPVDGSTLLWQEGDRVSRVIPESHGSFMALAAYDEAGRPDYSRVIFYMRCGTAGATAASQICVAK
jgi:hypothetical protein